MITLDLPDEVLSLWLAQQSLKRHFGDSGLKFTLDGRLVGDIAEAVAVEAFGLSFPKIRTPGVDAICPKRRTVQIKSTGLANMGPAFSPGEGIARHLLFLRLNFAENKAYVLYNGPEDPVRRLLPSKPWFGTKRLKLNDVMALEKKVRISQRLQLKRP